MLLLKKKKSSHLTCKYATGLEKISLIMTFFLRVQPGRQHLKEVSIEEPLMDRVMLARLIWSEVMRHDRS